jgi:hypothetical protein
MNILKRIFPQWEKIESSAIRKSPDGFYLGDRYRKKKIFSKGYRYKFVVKDSLIV